MPKKITDLAAKAIAALADIIPIVDLSDNTTKRTTVAGLKGALDPTVTTDANGWKVYDHGTYKEYVKTANFSGTINFAASNTQGDTNTLWNSTNLPVGIASLAAVRELNFSIRGTGATILITSASADNATAITLTGRNIYNQAVSVTQWSGALRITA